MAFIPVRDYLDGLQWDGKPRIDSWLIDYGGAEDTEYTRAVSALMLIAAVRRVRQPGCKFDEMVVIENEDTGHRKVDHVGNAGRYAKTGSRMTCRSTLAARK